MVPVKRCYADIGFDGDRAGKRGSVEAMQAYSADGSFFAYVVNVRLFGGVACYVAVMVLSSRKTNRISRKPIASA